MKDKVKCDYCDVLVKEQGDVLPTWFGRYKGSELILVICKDCFPNNKEKWREGKV